MSLFLNQSLLDSRLESFSQHAMLFSALHAVPSHEITVGTGVMSSLENLCFNFLFVSWHNLWHSAAFLLDLS